MSSGHDTPGPPAPEVIQNKQINPETIQDDDLCPICHLLLRRPVTTRCNHTLCEFCMTQWADVSTSQMPITGVDEEPTEFSASEVEARCPMCRTNTTASFDPGRDTRLKAQYPKTYAEREAEELASEADGSASQIETMTLYIGNKHRYIRPDAGSSNIHEWTFFVKPSRTDIIEEVHILLHPTFRPNHVVRKEPPYEIRRLGWGYFTIIAYVVLKRGYSWVSEDAVTAPNGNRKSLLPLEWTLDFSGYGGRGSMGRCRLKIRAERMGREPEEWEDAEEREYSEWEGFDEPRDAEEREFAEREHDEEREER